MPRELTGEPKPLAKAHLLAIIFTVYRPHKHRALVEILGAQILFLIIEVIFGIGDIFMNVKQGEAVHVRGKFHIFIGDDDIILGGNLVLIVQSFDDELQRFFAAQFGGNFQKGLSDIDAGRKGKRHLCGGLADDIAIGRVEVCRAALQAGQKFLPAFRQLQTVAHPIEKHDAQFFFQKNDLLGYGRL